MATKGRNSPVADAGGISPGGESQVARDLAHQRERRAQDLEIKRQREERRERIRKTRELELEKSQRDRLEADLEEAKKARYSPRKSKEVWKDAADFTFILWCSTA